MRTRGPRLLILIVVGVLAAAGLTGCTDDDERPGPGQDALLPAAELTYPGATEIDRSFEEADSGRYIDGDTFDHSARLDRELAPPPSTPEDEVLAWYRDQMDHQGWTDPVLDSDSLSIQFTSDDIYHRYRVWVGRGANASRTVTIQYRMSWRDE